MLNDKNLKNILYDYFREYLEIAIKNQTGYILESPKWRANSNWGPLLGYSKQQLFEINKEAIEDLKLFRNKYRHLVSSILISGCIGPANDGYQVRKVMTVKQATAYHNSQVLAFKESGADLTTAMTMNYLNEALGVTIAAQNHKLAVVMSCTVETDGKLPSGETLQYAIERIDELTDGYPLYYMINCAHPTHFANQLEDAELWKLRISGIRANASCKSHAELDESTELDPGDRYELAVEYDKLKSWLPNLKVYGGCCGTDTSHMKSICERMVHREQTEPVLQ